MSENRTLVGALAELAARTVIILWLILWAFGMATFDDRAIATMLLLLALFA